MEYLNFAINIELPFYLFIFKCYLRISRQNEARSLFKA